jgi:hypothetical protein
MGDLLLTGSSTFKYLRTKNSEEYSKQKSVILIKKVRKHTNRKFTGTNQSVLSRQRHIGATRRIKISPEWGRNRKGHRSLVGKPLKRVL